MWRSIGARATGTSHAGDGSPCQDAFSFVSLNDDLVAIAVADGAGSAPFSASGAELATSRAVQYLRNVADLVIDDPSTWPPAIRGAFEAARGSVMDFGQARGIEVRQLATTLQVVLLGRSACCYGRIGDGGGVGRRDGTLVPLSPPPGNLFPNETTFLTTAGSEPDVFFHADELSDCAIFTDGIQPLAMHLSQWKPHDPFFGPLFEFLRTSPDTSLAQDDLGAYLGTERFDRRTDDDRTLVIAVWTEDGSR
jgi:Protein phosphatase 2C